MSDDLYRRMYEMQAEINRLRSEREEQCLQSGLSLMTDRMSALPVRVTLYRRPTPEQWQRMIDLTLEIQNNPQEA